MGLLRENQRAACKEGMENAADGQTCHRGPGTFDTFDKKSSLSLYSVSSGLVHRISRSRIGFKYFTRPWRKKYAGGICEFDAGFLFVGKPEAAGRDDIVGTAGQTLQHGDGFGR